jgi:protein-S-isoprenylcysteine O-methyltransferase Ste14
MGFPYLYNPPGWVRFWSPDVPVGPLLRTIGVTCTVVGVALTLGLMVWFGLRRALGLAVTGLARSGPYRLTRNPQLLAASLFVVGPALLWPSWYALGWVLLYGIVAHLMVLTEEEHLRRVHGEAYAAYCRQVARYLGWPRQRRG